MDSTDIKAEGESPWNVRRYGVPERRLQYKLTMGIDEETLDIRAVEVTNSGIGGARMLPDFLSQIPPDQELGSVSAEGAYDTRKCHVSIAARNAHAVIPPRKNAKLWKPKTPGTSVLNEAVRSSKYMDRTVWLALTGHRHWSRVETNMHYVKLLGQRLSARDFDRQVANGTLASILPSYELTNNPAFRLICLKSNTASSKARVLWSP